MTSSGRQEKPVRIWFTEGVKRASQEFTSLLILNHESYDLQKDFYELYAIHKFGAKKNCTSEDKLIFAVMKLLP